MASSGWTHNQPAADPSPRAVSDAETIWRGKTDEQVIAAAVSLDDYTEDGRHIILAEAARRGLHVDSLVREVKSLHESDSARAGSRLCAYCGTSILFGGSRDGPFRFCNAECRMGGIMLSASYQIAEPTVRERLRALHDGLCPVCGREGPVDTYTSHRALSIVVLTRWSNRVRTSCRRCANVRRLHDSAYSLALGWWGIPFGPPMTVIQVCRNLAGVLRRGDDSPPSSQLETIVRLQIAAEQITDRRERQTVV